MVLQIKRDTRVESIIPTIAVRQSYIQIGLSKAGELSFTVDNKTSGGTNASIIHFTTETFAGSLRSRYCIQTKVNAEYPTK